MTRQYGPKGPGDKSYQKRLFVDTGYSFMEVGARVIEPYGSPVPTPNMKEHKIINAPSHIQTLGMSSYKATLVLLFRSRNAYAEYMSLIGWTHKYYDERGQIWTGAVESIKATPVEANRRYKVEIALVLIKKDMYDHSKFSLSFQDIKEGDFGYKEVYEMARLGIIATNDQNGNEVLYFSPNEFMTRGQLAAFLMRTKRLIEKMIRE